MKTLEIVVTEEFAANLKRVARILGVPENSPGVALEAACGWALEQLAIRRDEDLEAVVRKQARAALRGEEVCLYCGCDVHHSDDVPLAQDEAAWETLSQEHAKDCEWVCTRAHRRIIQ